MYIGENKDRSKNDNLVTSIDISTFRACFDK